MTKQKLVIAVIVAGMSLSGVSLACREEGPAERLGRAIDETASDVADSVNDAAEDANDRIRRGVEEASR